jgi:hypothetical protein
MPAQPRSVDDLLRTAYADLAATVRPEDLPREASAPSEQSSRRSAVRRAAHGHSRWAIPVAAGAAVLLVVAAATLIPRALGSGSQSPTRTAWPRGMAYAIAYVSGKPAGFFQATTPVVIPVNLATGRALAPIRLDVHGWPLGVALAPDGRTIYVLTGGARTGGQVVPFDVATGRAGRPIWVGGSPGYMLITPNGRTGYIVRPPDGPTGITVLNLAQSRYAGFLRMPEAGSIALTPNGRTLYVASPNGGTVTPVSTANNKAGRPITTTRNAYCLGPCASIAVTPDGRTVYVAAARATHGAVLTPISTATNAAGPPINLKFRIADLSEYLSAITMSPNGETAYVQAGNATVLVSLVTATALPALRFLPNESGVSGSAYFSGDSKIVIMPGRDRLYRFAAATAHPLRTISLGPSSLYSLGGAIGPDGRTFYVYGLLTGKRVKNPNVLIPVNIDSGAIGRDIVLPADITGEFLVYFG